MKDTNQLPPLPEWTNERIDYIADLTVKGMPDGIRGFLVSWGWQQFARALIGNFDETMRAYALQARAQVQGVPVGYIHHFVAHDDSGVIIDTTWEADGCADPLPHPTFPAMWKWTHCTPFYTTPHGL